MHAARPAPPATIRAAILVLFASLAGIHPIKKGEKRAHLPVCGGEHFLLGGRLQRLYPQGRLGKREALYYQFSTAEVS